MGLAGGLMKAFGGYRNLRRNLPYKPQYTRYYENKQLADIKSLYTPEAYTGSTLGYTPEQMEGKFGEGRDLAAGEAAAERQRTEDRFRASGGLGLQSAMYARAKQREDLANVQRVNELKRRMIIDDAEQRRADKLARIAAVTGAYEFGVGGHNVYKKARREETEKLYGGLGEAGDSAMMGAGLM
jgi:hypothetical protein